MTDTGNVSNSSNLPNLSSLSSLLTDILDSDAEVRLLRNEQHADEKNDRMMAILNTKEWWLQYKREFDARRKLDEDRFEAGLPPSPNPYPKHPSQLVEEVEKRVDADMRKLYPGYER